MKFYCNIAMRISGKRRIFKKKGSCVHTGQTTLEVVWFECLFSWSDKECFPSILNFTNFGHSIILKFNIKFQKCCQILWWCWEILKIVHTTKVNIWIAETWYGLILKNMNIFKTKEMSNLEPWLKQILY